MDNVLEKWFNIEYSIQINSKFEILTYGHYTNPHRLQKSYKSMMGTTVGALWNVLELGSLQNVRFHLQ